MPRAPQRTSKGDRCRLPGSDGNETAPLERHGAGPADPTA